jgi:predicted enzyme related to lactoylglutathione lyase
VHWEIRAREPEKIRAFYSTLFNWEIGDGRVMNIPAGIGGPESGPAGHIMPGEASRVVLYFQVRDLRESMSRAAELGGKATRQPFDIPGGPTIAGIEDPEGNPVVLVQQ